MIKIDSREQELFTKCQQTIELVPKFKDIKIVSQTLPLGDIIINDGTNDCVIIERKTLADLASSIKDGRYEEQSYRLNGLPHHNHNIIYLIEGDVNRFNSFKERIDKQTLYSAMFSINYFKGFSVMRSNNLEETSMIACNMVYKLVNGLKSGKTAFYNQPPANKQNNDKEDNNEEKDTEKKEVTEKDYCSVIKKVKKENITPDNIGEIMLCQIPGISSVTALAIMEKYNNLPNLIKEIENNNDCLKDITSTNAKGQIRKINKTSIANIVKFLLKK